LTPSLGYLFDRKWLYPYESLISILWKFEKANALSGNVVARLLGPDVDPYEGLVPRLGVIDIDRLRANLQVSRRSLRTALIPAAMEHVVPLLSTVSWLWLPQHPPSVRESECVPRTSLCCGVGMSPLRPRDTVSN